MKSRFPWDVRSCECTSQASEAGVCFMSRRLVFVLQGWMGGGPYLLTHELQTQVDIDMSQMLLKQSNVGVEVCHRAAAFIVNLFILSFLSAISSIQTPAAPFIQSCSLEVFAHLESYG